MTILSPSDGRWMCPFLVPTNGLMRRGDIATCGRLPIGGKRCTLFVYGAPLGEYMANSTEKRAAALGLTSQTVGKTQARKQFFPLVDSLCSANSAVEITDHDVPVAVLMSYQNYVALTAKACLHAGHVKPKVPNLMGSVVINSDLDAASAKIAELFKASLDKSAGSL